MDDYTFKVIVSFEEHEKRFRDYRRLCLRHEEMLEKLEKNFSDVVLLPMLESFYATELIAKRICDRCTTEEIILKEQQQKKEMLEEVKWILEREA